MLFERLCFSFLAPFLFHTSLSGLLLNAEIHKYLFTIIGHESCSTRSFYTASNSPPPPPDYPPQSLYAVRSQRYIFEGGGGEAVLRPPPGREALSARPPFDPLFPDSTCFQWPSPTRVPLKSTGLISERSKTRCMDTSPDAVPCTPTTPLVAVPIGAGNAAGVLWSITDRRPLIKLLFFQWNIHCRYSRELCYAAQPLRGTVSLLRESILVVYSAFRAAETRTCAVCCVRACARSRSSKGWAE